MTLVNVMVTLANEVVAKSEGWCGNGRKDGVATVGRMVWQRSGQWCGEGRKR